MVRSIASFVGTHSLGAGRSDTRGDARWLGDNHLVRVLVLIELVEQLIVGCSCVHDHLVRAMSGFEGARLLGGRSLGSGGSDACGDAHWLRDQRY